MLITGAGGIIAQGIIKSLKFNNKLNKNKISYKILSSDSSPLSVGLFCVDKGLLVPKSNDPNYIDSLIRIMKTNFVDALYVGTDPELDVLHKNKQIIEEATESKVLINSSDVIDISRDKWKTFQFLKNNGFPVANSTLPENMEQFAKEYGYPIVVKPREGFGSRYFSIANNRQELDAGISNIYNAGWNPIIQEYINEDEKEHTTGVVTSERNNKIISSISINKLSKYGQTYKAFINNDIELRRLSEHVAVSLESKGAINIQTRFQDNHHKIIEINPRFSASCPMRTVAGINEPDLVYRNNVLNEEINIEVYKELISLRFWDEVYIDNDVYTRTVNLGFIENYNPYFPGYLT